MSKYTKARTDVMHPYTVGDTTYHLHSKVVDVKNGAVVVPLGSRVALLKFD